MDKLLTVEIVDRGPDVVIAVAGELDFGTTPELVTGATPWVQAGRSVILDLAGVGFCDSSALTALIRLHNTAAAAGGTLVVAGLQPQVRTSVTVSMLDQLLVIVDTVPAPRTESSRP